VTLQQQIRSNRFRSGIVVLGFALLLLVLAGLIGLVLDVSLAIIVLAIAAAYGLFGLLSSRNMIAGMTGVQPLGPEDLKPLRRLVDNVSIGAGLPVTPELRIVDDPAPNACGRPADHKELRRRDDWFASSDAEARARSRHRTRDLAHS